MVLHPYNNVPVEKCGWADTFLVIAWLIRVCLELAAETVALLPMGLDYADCLFKERICLSDYQPPLSNLLSLYHFFIDHIYYDLFFLAL